MARKSLLACGLAASLLYVAMNVFVPMQWDAYSSFSQTISELSAIDAPTRSVIRSYCSSVTTCRSMATRRRCIS